MIVAALRAAVTKIKIMRQQQEEITNRGRAGRGWGGAIIALASLVALSGCHTDMWRQPYIKPYYQSDFYPDQQASRPLVIGTVPQGDLKTSDPNYYTGKGADGKTLIRTIPVRAVQSFASPKAMLAWGQDRYNAYCTPCHGKTGNGNGFITQRGLGYWQKLPASYHTDRLRKIEDGHIYDTITNGYGIMYSYASRIQDPNDRWAVVAYVRALQLMYAGQPTANQPQSPVPASSNSELPIRGVAPRTGNGPGLPIPGPTGAPPRPETLNAAPPGPGRPRNTPPSPGSGLVRPPDTGESSGGAR